MISDLETARNIAANVRRLLEARQWSGRELARRTGEEPTTISRITRATNMPGAGVVARVAEAFDVSLDRLTGPPPKKLPKKQQIGLRSA